MWSRDYERDCKALLATAAQRIFGKCRTMLNLFRSRVVAGKRVLAEEIKYRNKKIPPIWWVLFWGTRSCGSLRVVIGVGSVCTIEFLAGAGGSAQSLDPMMSLRRASSGDNLVPPTTTRSTGWSLLIPSPPWRMTSALVRVGGLSGCLRSAIRPPDACFELLPFWRKSPLAVVAQGAFTLAQNKQQVKSLLLKTKK